MEMERTLKRIRKKESIFFIAMISIAILVPVLAFLANLNSTFVYVYIVSIEILILISILVKINICTLRFKYYNGRFKIRQGLFFKESIILCDNVALVHTNKEQEDIELVIIMSSRFRNKKARLVTQGFFNKYSEIEDEYIRIKRINEDESYYYQIIKSGSLRKYIFLEKIYTTCVKAVYTQYAIESIKIA